MNAKTQNEDGMEAWANSQADRDDMMKNETLKASSECPVCGVNTQHPHSQEDLVSRIIALKRALPAPSAPNSASQPDTVGGLLVIAEAMAATGASATHIVELIRAAQEAK